MISYTVKSTVPINRTFIDLCQEFKKKINDIHKNQF